MVVEEKFFGGHFPKCIVPQVVYWYLRYSLSYRDIEELRNERGIEIDHATAQRWVVKKLFDNFATEPKNFRRITFGVLPQSPYQTCFTGPKYLATCLSAVNNMIPSAMACATSKRSNGSLWIVGKVLTATTCLLRMGNS